LSDFHPKGRASQAHDLYNEARGATFRAVLAADKQGSIRFRETYEPGILPDPSEILAVIDALN
jgi:alkyl hydroperoxide reductase subunit AhpC